MRGVLLALALVFAGCAQTGLAPAKRDWSQPVDFAQLRMQLSARDDFPALCGGLPPGTLYELVGREQWGLVVKRTDQQLAVCPIDIDAHFLRAIALRNLGFVGEAEQHIQWYSSLLDTVLASGDGKSKATPYLVVSVPEEYAVLRALRFELRSQALEDSIDAALVVDEKGEESTLYFDLSAGVRRTQRSETP